APGVQAVFSGIQSAPPDYPEITGFPFNETLVFNDLNAIYKVEDYYRAFVYKIELAEPTVLTFESDNGGYFIVWEEPELDNSICDGYSTLTCSFGAGTYYLSIDDDDEGDFTTNITIEKYFTEISKFPFTAKLDFSEATVILEGGAHAFAYEFTLAEQTALSFNAKNCGIDLFNDPLMQDQVAGSIDGFVKDLTAGTYYVFIGDNAGANIVDVTINAFYPETFKINEISLPFSEELFFHPDYNSEAKGSLIIKAFKLVLDEDTQLRYTYSSNIGLYSPLGIYADEGLSYQIAQFDLGEIQILPQGEYYLMFKDNGHYAWTGNYYNMFAKFEKFDGYDFTEINQFPFTAKLDFNSETESSWGSRVFMYEFELTETMSLTFSSSNNDRIYFNLYRDAIFNDWLTGNYEFSIALSPGTYYLAVCDDYGDVDEFSANIKITAEEIKQEPLFKVVDMTLPFSAYLYFHPDHNSTTKGNEIVKAFKLDLSEKTTIKYAAGGDGEATSTLYIYNDEALTNFTGRWYYPSEIFTLEAGTYYFAFRDNGFHHHNNVYLGALTKLEIIQTEELAFKDIELPYLERQLDFTHDAGAFYDINRYEYWQAFTFTLDQDATVYFYGYNEDLDWNPALYISNTTSFDDYEEGGPTYINPDGYSIFLEAGTYYIALGDDGYNYNNGNYLSTYFYVSLAEDKPGDITMPPEIVIPKTFAVTFNSEGGTAVASQAIEEWEFVAEPVAPTKAGFTFEGWYNGTKLWNFANDFITEDTTLTAKWKVKTFTVTFINDGTTVAQQTIDSLLYVTKPADPSKAGFTFEGWYNGVNPWNFASDKVTGNITLTAIWKVKTFTVTFSSEGGTTVAPQTIDSLLYATKPADPSKAGFTFEGWYNGASLWNFASDKVTGNITLTAKWTEIPVIPVKTFTVTFINDGATWDEQIIDSLAYATKPVNPTKSGYVLIGWYNGMESWDFASDKVTENITLTARWDALTPFASPKIAASNIKAHAIGNTIMLQNVPQNANVQIYNLQGKRVHRRDAMHRVSTMGEMQISVQSKGMYIIKAGGQVLRVTIVSND
ncbi:MAG: InlB B-repeat-containing protein, partial [Fibromonadales bacterium]|nr:InlB B-repeat-containing protein [Fibromonadales bacterium]